MMIPGPRPGRNPPPDRLPWCGGPCTRTKSSGLSVVPNVAFGRLDAGPQTSPTSKRPTFAGSRPSQPRVSPVVAQGLRRPDRAREDRWGLDKGSEARAPIGRSRP